MSKVVEDPRLRNKQLVFENREEAGKVLAAVLRTEVKGMAIVMAIPSGGIPIAASISRQLGWPMDLTIVRKLQIPFQPEAGFGAITLQGEMILNERLVSELQLTKEEIEKARVKALEAGRSREAALRVGLKHLPLQGREVVIVDDGLASGFTMLAAIGQARGQGPKRLMVAVPTGSKQTVEMIAPEVDLLVCLNIRGTPFAVADAYRHWHDLDEEEALAILNAGT